jgi:hypothetical protein
LHFDEETFVAERIKQSPPFSQERASLMQRAYELVHAIILEKARKEDLPMNLGASDIFCILVEDLIEKYKNQTGKDKIVFYEAGVGMGMIVSSLAHNDGVVIKGCDISLNANLKENHWYDLYEGSLFDSLKQMRNASIDIFYWNDVLEHLPDDEIQEYIEMIYEKIVDKGIIITITPSRLTGPHDISVCFRRRGTKAQGLHFHEYTYSELKKMYISYGFKNSYPILKYPKRPYAIFSDSAFLISAVNFFRFLAESMSFCIYPWSLREAILNGLACSVTVFKK